MGVVWEWEGSYLLGIPEISLDFGVRRFKKCKGKKTGGRKDIFSTWTGNGGCFSSSFESAS